MSRGRDRSWEGEERRARMAHAVRLVRRGADRAAVAREFGVSADVLAKWLRRAAA